MSLYTKLVPSSTTLLDKEISPLFLLGFMYLKLPVIGFKPCMSVVVSPDNNLDIEPLCKTLDYT